MSTKELTEKQDAMRAAARYEVMQAIDKNNTAVIEIVTDQLIRNNSSQELCDKYEVAYPQQRICTNYGQLYNVMYEATHRANPLAFFEYNEDELRELYKTKHSLDEAVAVAVAYAEDGPISIEIIHGDIDSWIAWNLAVKYLRLFTGAE